MIKLSAILARCANVQKTLIKDAQDAKFVRLYKLAYTDPTGKERPWESAERTTRKGEIDAVAIFPIINNPDGSQHTILVSQYRPPVAKVVLELPAGLVDANETPEGAALRELKEETGYFGEVKSTSPVLWNDVGMSNANMRLVVVSVDRTLPENQNPIAVPDDGEYIERHVVPIKDLVSILEDFEKQGGAVDSRLYHFAAGFQFSRL
ncbi:NUDIX hydrolase domain-like protein [Cladochytrium replicatum]|nr:NUDIX hydrolase domain-like protein [Cladochytrium replicatum]